MARKPPSRAVLKRGRTRERKRRRAILEKYKQGNGPSRTLKELILQRGGLLLANLVLLAAVIRAATAIYFDSNAWDNLDSLKDVGATAFVALSLFLWEIFGKQEPYRFGSRKRWKKVRSSLKEVRQSSVRDLRASLQQRTSQIGQVEKDIERLQAEKQLFEVRARMQREAAEKLEVDSTSEAPDGIATLVTQAQEQEGRARQAGQEITSLLSRKLGLEQESAAENEELASLLERFPEAEVENAEEQGPEAQAASDFEQQESQAEESGTAEAGLEQGGDAEAQGMGAAEPETKSESEPEPEKAAAPYKRRFWALVSLACWGLAIPLTLLLASVLGTTAPDASESSLKRPLVQAPVRSDNEGAEAALQSIEPLREQAEAGDVQAMERLAHRLLWGLKVEVDAKAAFDWYQRAADSGSVKALEALAGWCYGSGMGTEEDKRAAVRTWKLALAAGSQIAGSRLRFLISSTWTGEACRLEGVSHSWLDEQGVARPEPAPEPKAEFVALCRAAANNDVETLTGLIEDGVDLNGRGGRGRTALHAAARSGAVETCRLLLAGGAELECRDDLEMTPLMVACSEGRKAGKAIAVALIEAGADVNGVRQSDTMTALMFASDPEVIEALLDRGAEVDGPPGSPLTPLMLAARANNLEALRILVERGADTQRTCGLSWAEGWTARQLAEHEDRKQAAAYLRSLEESQE